MIPSFLPPIFHLMFYFFYNSFLPISSLHPSFSSFFSACLIFHSFFLLIVPSFHSFLCHSFNLALSSLLSSLLYFFRYFFCFFFFFSFLPVSFVPTFLRSSSVSSDFFSFFLSPSSPFLCRFPILSFFLPSSLFYFFLPLLSLFFVPSFLPFFVSSFFPLFLLSLFLSFP